MDWKMIVTHAGFEEQAECIAEHLKRAKIDTLLQLQNSTGKLGHICQADIYQLVAAVNKVFSEGLPEETDTSADVFESEVEPEELSFEEDLTENN